MSEEQNTTGGKYFLDNDDEIGRLKTQHEFWKYYLDGEIVMPWILHNLKGKDNVEILDSGTADGLWLRDVSGSLPDAKFVGTDTISSFFPSPSETPSNFTYTTQDILRPWPESYHNRFDLVHQRLVFPAAMMGQGDFRPVLGALAKVVKPGGWIQLQEVDPTAIPPPPVTGPAMGTFLGILTALSPGGDKEYVAKLKGALEELGFEDLQEKSISGEAGATCEDKELGMRQAHGSAGAVGGIATLLKGKGMIPDEVLETLQERYVQELETQGGALPCRVVWGRKRA